MIKATHGLDFLLFNTALAGEMPFGMLQYIYNAFFMELPMAYFEFHSSLLIEKC